MSSFVEVEQTASVLRFGMIADVYHGLQDDAEARLDAFLEAASEHEFDFIIQLGGFCYEFLFRDQRSDDPPGMSRLNQSHRLIFAKQSLSS